MPLSRETIFVQEIIDRSKPLIQETSTLMGRYFRNVRTFTTKQVTLETKLRTRRLAAFVSPMVAGKPVTGAGRKELSFTPFYIKEMARFDPSSVQTRSVGEPLSTPNTPQQRLDEQRADAIRDHLDAIKRREEWMIIQLLYSGRIQYAGDVDYPAVDVNFERASDLTVTLGGGSLWTDAGVNPINDLRIWNDRLIARSGAGLSEVIMSERVWDIFINNDNVKAHINFWKSDNQQPWANPEFRQVEGLRYMGRSSTGQEFFAYSANYTAVPGQPETTLFPANGLIGTTSTIVGTRNYGMIHDHDADVTAREYFVKSWREQNPSAENLMIQSAPLPALDDINTSFSATVAA